MSTNEVTRTTHLGAAPDDVRRALDDADLLSAWLGPWTPIGADRAQVTTDDGVVRSVRREPPERDGEIRWAWWPGTDEDEASTVVISVVPEGDGTRLTVVETANRAASASASADGRPAALALDGLGWTIAVLALEIALAVRCAVRV